MPNSNSRSKVLIRKAIENDAAAIVHVHYAAVHVTASKDYDEAILESWSRLTDDRVKQLETYIGLNPENTYMVVAEVDGDIVGFGEIVPNNNELRAVYVSPTAGRAGIGRALLLELETVARKHGVPKLWLDSSLTAEPFYSANGYLTDGQSEHQLRSGEMMKCVKMHKNFSD